MLCLSKTLLYLCILWALSSLAVYHHRSCIAGITCTCTDLLFAEPFTVTMCCAHLLVKLTKHFGMKLFCYPWVQRKLVLTAVTNPRTSSQVSWFFLLLVQATKMFPIMGSINITVQVHVKWASMNKTLLLLSSLTVHCSYRLKFFAAKDHLWDGNSLSQLQSSWL